MSGGKKTDAKLWDKGAPLDKQIEAYTVGDDYILDQKLIRYDCRASIAHAKMLAAAGLLKNAEAAKLAAALEEIISLDSRGKFSISRGEEDCHTAIERYLTEKLGDLGKKIHTARSRNDQVLTALRLYYKDALKECELASAGFIRALASFVKKYGAIPLPGYTHTRKAMPSSVALWAGAFIDAAKDDIRLLQSAYELVDQSPLGSGAGYGVPLEIDRGLTAKLLGFDRVQENPIYVQLSRGKFESTMLHAFSQIMLDLNKLACDLILFTLPEFGYFELPEEFCTGSSIMPQKKNPDALELVRGNYHTVNACEFQVKNTIGNLISGYNRDLQLTKKPVMTGVDVTLESLSVMSLVFGGLRVNGDACRKAMTDELYATAEAYKLVKKGMPFRDAYKLVAKKFP